MNRELNGGNPLSLYIEAVKDGEEPVAFGPYSVLVDYGYGWKLQTVTGADLTSSGKVRSSLFRFFFSSFFFNFLPLLFSFAVIRCENWRSC